MEYVRHLRSALGTDKIMVPCAAAWIENKHGVLLERRADNGRWGLLGGLMELGESADECLLREIKEETGLEAKVEGLIGIYTKYHHEYANGDQAQPIVAFFNLQVPEDEVMQLSSESIALQYFSRENLPELGMPQHQDMAKDALAGRRGVFR